MVECVAQAVTIMRKSLKLGQIWRAGCLVEFTLKNGAMLVFSLLIFKNRKLRKLNDVETYVDNQFVDRMAHLIDFISRSGQLIAQVNQLGGINLVHNPLPIKFILKQEKIFL